MNTLGGLVDMTGEFCKVSWSVSIVSLPKHVTLAWKGFVVLGKSSDVSILITTTNYLSVFAFSHCIWSLEFPSAAGIVDADWHAAAATI